MTESACLRPRQCGVGVRNAAEMVGMGLQRFVQSKAAQGAEDYVVLQVDMRNAFNSISRGAVLKGCAAKVPSAYYWLKFCMVEPAHCTAKDAFSAIARSGSTKATHAGPLPSHLAWTKVY